MRGEFDRIFNKKSFLKAQMDDNKSALKIELKDGQGSAVLLVTLRGSPQVDLHFVVYNSTLEFV